MSTTEDDGNSSPMLPSDSPGSSVSACLQDEYQELLKYAVITPHFNPEELPKTLAEAAAYPAIPKRDNLIFEDSSGTATETSASGSETTPPDSLQQRESVMATGTLGSSTEEQVDISDVTTEDEVPRSSVPVQMTPKHPNLLRNLLVPNQLETPDSDKSGLSEADTSTSTMGSPSVMDHDIAHMEAQLDNWTLELKRNVLAEFSQAKISLIEKHRQEIHRIKDRHSREVSQLQNDIENLKELLHTYELSIERKDHVITNLTRAVQKQKERFEMLRRFESWKLKHNEEKRESFTSRIAAKHHERRQMTKVWAAWHSIIEAKWRQRVEKACQTKAQEVCMQLTNDYETRIASLNEALESSRAEVSRLHAEREHYEETMKKAFMRGVCALNLEAMQIFHENEEAEGGAGGGAGAGGGGGGGGVSHPPPPSQFSQQDQQPPSTSRGPTTSMPRTVTSQSAYTRGTVTQGVSGVRKTTTTTRPTQSHKAPKTITAKVSARSDGQRLGQSLGGSGQPPGLAPPMSSVIVERHHPVTQQTLGHAMASRYPQQSLPQHQNQRSSQPTYTRPTASTGGISQRRLAGQSGKIPLAGSSMHTVKVVH